MEPLFAELGLWVVVAAVILAVVAGAIKGMTGFALPMIIISGLGSFMTPELALAGLILPALITNLLQALRQGLKAAFASAREHWRYLILVLFLIAVSSQFVLHIPDTALFLLLGVTVAVFATLQLAGWRPRIDPSNHRKAEFGIGSLAGVLGGLTGTWGPPTVLYLTALNVPKVEHVRIQGVVYSAGAITLTIAHLQSGVLSGSGLQLSWLLVLPALAGMSIGMAVQSRLDQDRFRQVVLLVLVLAGLNLIRRGIFG